MYAPHKLAIEVWSTDIIIQTDGKGLWSKARRALSIDKVEIIHGGAFIKAYWAKGHWDTSRHGLIYTDERALAGLRAGLAEFVDNIETLRYTEQGMQGDDFISLQITTSQADRP